MIILKQKTFLFIVSLFSLVQIVQAQSIVTDPGSYGFIIWGGWNGYNGNYVGTGFVLKEKRTVITCAHVVDTTHQFYFQSTRFRAVHKLTLIKLLPQYDLAILESDGDLCDRPFDYEDSFTFTPNQHLFYVGFDPSKSSDSSRVLQVGSAHISGVGTSFEGKNIYDYIEFIGIGIPGYSGGPVINDRGKIVGIMREAWYKKGLKPGPTWLMNRAFSILPLIKTEL